MANFRGLKARGKLSVTVLEAVQNDGMMASHLATKAAKEQRPVYLKHIREHYESSLRALTAALENAPGGAAAAVGSKKFGPPANPTVEFSTPWEELNQYYLYRKVKQGYSHRHKQRTGAMARAVAVALATKGAAKPIGDPKIARRGYVESGSRVKPVSVTKEYKRYGLPLAARPQPGTVDVLVEMGFDLVKLPLPLDGLVRQSYVTGTPSRPGLAGREWKAQEPLERLMFGEVPGEKRPQLYRPLLPELAAAWGRDLERHLKATT
jgi:hypothetical protein